MQNQTFEVLYFALLSILLAVGILIAIVLILNYLKIFEVKRKQKWNLLIDQLLVEAITRTEIAERNDQIPYELLKNNSFRKLLTLRIVEASQKFSGTSRQQLRSYYQSMDLHTYSLNKLLSNRESTIAEAIRELSVMEQVDLLPQIKEFIHHPSKTVYLEAQSALVKNYGFEGLHFMDRLDKTLSKWQMLRLLIAVKEVQPEQLEKIKTWLLHDNPSVVSMALMLVKKFRLWELHAEVSTLLTHENKEIVKNTITALTYIENDSTSKILTSIYHNKDTEIQLEIMCALGKIRDQDTYPFIKEQLLNSKSTDIRIQAAKNLESGTWTGWSTDIDDTVTLAIVRHAKSELI